MILFHKGNFFFLKKIKNKEQKGNIFCVGIYRFPIIRLLLSWASSPNFFWEKKKHVDPKS